MPSAVERTVAVVSAIRTPIGKYGGSLRELSAVQLGTVAAHSAIGKSGIPPADIEEVLFGHCIEAGAGQNPARQVLRGARIPDSSGASTINMVCGSGMKALHLGFSEIRSGAASRVLVGGMESMSRAPYLVDGAIRWGIKYGNRPLVDAMRNDALVDAYGEHEEMGLTGERIARKLGLSRVEIDAFGLRSHERAFRATRDGTFASEIVAVPPGIVPRSAGLDHDEGPRGDTSMVALSRLKPAFGLDGVLTAGSSSSLADGGAALVLASAHEVEHRRLKPLAWIHSICVSGVDPSDVMESPIPTVGKHLAATGFTPEEFDRVEHNEAFASASIAVMRAFGFTDRQFNVHGGAIALGHPIGMSGARIVVTLVHELVRSNTSLGLATLCMGGGNGLSVIIDRRGL
ncbi:MAG: acetyl-CoA C-acyltransferase [Thermoplasmata archaeon]